MEQKLTQAFDALHMDKSCISRIEQAMTRPRRFPARSVVRAATAACLAAAVLLIALTPTVAQAVENLTQKIRGFFSRTTGTVVLEEDFVYYNDGHIELESNTGSATGTVYTSSYPAWLIVMDDRVYFTGNEESTDIRYFLENKEQFDITGQFSEEEPFLSTFEKDGITHYIAVGGDFDPEVGIDSIGYLERLRRTDKIEDGIYAGWIAGHGHMKYRDADAGLYPIWYAKAVVELELPWDNQEAQQQLKDWEAGK